MKKHSELFRDFNSIVTKDVTSEGSPQHLLSLVKLRRVLSSKTISVEELSKYVDRNAYSIMVLLEEANRDLHEDRYSTDTESAITHLGTRKSKRLLRRAVCEQLNSYGKVFTNDDLFRKWWLRTVYLSAACEVIAQDTKSVSHKEARMCGTLLLVGGLYLLYHISRIRAAFDYTEDIKYLVYKHYLSITCKIIELCSLPSWIKESFDIDDIDPETIEYPPETLKELLYMANSLVDNSVIWTEDTDLVTFAVADYMALNDRITERYKELCDLYLQP